MLDPVPMGESRCVERRVEVDRGISLRVLDWRSAGHGDRAALVFVAGWVSVVEGWMPLLEALARQRPVLYVETREKRSAAFDGVRLSPDLYTIPTLARDVIAVCDRLRVDGDRTILFGSSMGANAILEGLKHGALAARGAFLVGPNAEFRIPWWGRAVIAMPARWYHVLKHFVLWYLRHFRVDARREPEQLVRYRRTLWSADPVRLKLSARAVLGYRIWPGLETIETPVAIAFASSDRLHGEAEARRIVAMLRRGVALECSSNAYMHSAAVAADIDRFIVACGLE